MKKLKNESGSALILALFLMILVSIIIVSFSNQVANQIRSTINLNEDMQEMYNAESKIEKCIAEFISGINLEYKEDCKKYLISYLDKNDGNFECKGIKIHIKQGGSENCEVNLLETSNLIYANKGETIIFQLDIIDNENKKSIIEVNLSNIGDASYENNINYNVISWRERNIGVESLNE